MVKLKEDCHKAFASEFLAEYLENGMGVMSKKEIDLLVMHLLSEYSEIDRMSNHALSIELQSTESQIRNMRYQAKLRYPPKDARHVEKGLLEVFTRAYFDLDNKKIVFIVEDSYLRLSLMGRLKAKGMFADTSFNRELVKVDPEFLENVLQEMYGEKVAETYKSAFDAMLDLESADKDRITFRSLKKIVIDSAAEALGKAITPAFLAYLHSLIT